MLTFAEEIYLLALDDVSGRIQLSSRDIIIDSVLVGAVLSELAFMNRIDNDAENIYVINTESTSSVILNTVLDKFADADSDKFTIQHAMRVLMRDARKIEELVLAELIDKGILKMEEEKIFWIFSSRRYPIIDDKEIVDVETRLRRIVLSDEIPDPQDAVLISLVDACDLFSEILSPREFIRSKERIAGLSKLDLVGQKVKQLITQVQEYANIQPYV